MPSVLPTHPTPTSYTVRRGDSLSSIAARLFGNAERWPEIAAANGIQHPYRLFVDQELVIPQPGRFQSGPMLGGDPFPWLRVAIGEMYQQELKGREHNPRILHYLDTCGNLDGTVHQERDETAWCACFVGWCLEQVGLPSSSHALASSYDSYGRALPKPVFGAIVTFSRSAGSGHVGFCVGSDASRIYTLGGNQSNAVTVAPIARTRLRSVRWPDGAR